MRKRTLMTCFVLTMSASLANAFNHTDTADIVVRSRAIIKISNQDSKPRIAYAGDSGSQPIVIINDPKSRLNLDNSKFKIPDVSNTMLDFGSLSVSNLFDNDLNVCGFHRNRRCNKAYILIYTVDADGPGIFNSDYQYGIPLFVGTHPTKTPKTLVGWRHRNANLMHSIHIRPHRNTVKLSDFGELKYRFAADFSDAGAGVFETTIIIEYALAH